MAKLSENAVTVLNFLKENEGNYTAAMIADATGLNVKQVNGTITGGLIGRNNSRGLVERVEAGTDDKGKTIKYIKLTDKGMAQDPTAELE